MQLETIEIKEESPLYRIIVQIIGALLGEMEGEAVCCRLYWFPSAAIEIPLGYWFAGVCRMRCLGEWRKESFDDPDQRPEVFPTEIELLQQSVDPSEISLEPD